MQELKGCLLALLCLFAGSSYAQTPQVLVSVHPVAMLIKSAWPDVQVSTLMQANQSPHDFALRPSHRRIIAQAQHLVWLGHDLEPYLEKVVVGHHSSLDLSVLFSQTDTEQDHQEEHDGHEEHAHGHHHGGIDPHIWLKPSAIKSILALVQAQLQLPEPTPFLQRFDQWLIAAHKDLDQQKKGFVSFHDAFHYWVDEFQLNQIQVLAVNPEQPIGTRHLLDVRALLETGKVACLFVEPQFKASIVEKLSGGTQVPIVNIDPIGSQYPVNQGAFLEFYDYLKNQFITCVNPK